MPDAGAAARPRRPASARARSRPASARAIFIAFAADSTERKAIEDYVARTAPPGASRVEVVTAGESGRLAAALDGAEPASLVTPVGATWRSGPTSRLLHSSIRARVAGPPEVVEAAPATLAELRERYGDSGWEDEGPEGLAEFVNHQAMLALDRAERRQLGDRYKLPNRLREEIQRTQSFRQGAAAIAAAQDRPVAEVTELAVGCLDEMVTRQTRVGIDVLGQLRRTVLRGYRVEYDAAELEPLRELNRTRSLIFLPSHRSYMDPLVVNSILDANGFPPNHILGGINLDFWPFGPLARRAGIVFIRRSIKDDEVYKFALRQYLAYLVEKRFNLEWYVEGGRSRTGKLRPPRFGIFAYLVEAFRSGRAADVALVPVSLVYDQLHEATDMAREAHGASKRAENIGQLVRYLRAQGRRFGSIHVRFGAPMSLKETLVRAADRRYEVEKAVIEVCHRINEVTPITPNSLVTLSLLGFGDRALSVDEVRRVLAPLLDYVQRRRLPLTSPLLLRDRSGVTRTLEELSTGGVVTRFGEGLEPLYSIGPDQHLVAAYYRNAAIHFFIDRSIAELALERLREASGTAESTLEEAMAEARRVRELFKFEFFFPALDEQQTRLTAELELIGGGADQLSRAGLHLADRVLASFAEAYWLVADRLLALEPGKGVDEGGLGQDALVAGRQYLKQRRIQFPESLNAELFANALRVARQRGLLEPDGEAVETGRAAFEAELRSLLERLASIRAMAIADLDGARARRKRR